MTEESMTNSALQVKRSGARRLVVTLVAVAILALAFGVVWLQSAKYEPLTVGMAAPDFTLPDMAGKNQRLSDYRGKVVFLNFWATWCPPCREEMPSMERLHQTFKGRGLLVLAVNLQESPNLVRKFARNFGLSFPILLDETGEVSSAYGARAIPVTYLIDTNGSIAARAVGARDWASPAALGLIEKLAANAR
jgi:peroxiredoxin